MQSSQQEWVCVCGNSYQTERSLKQHQRRYCRGQAGSENICEICGKEFETYAGLRQHTKLSHKAEYNAMLKSESAGAKKLWTENEEDELAQIEAELERDTPAAEIIEKMMTISSRTRESLKARRRQPQFKAKVEQFRRQKAMEAMQSERDPVNEEHGSTNTERDETIKACLNGLVNRLTYSEDTHLVETICQQPRDVAQTAFDEWCINLLDSSHSNRTRPNRENTSRDQLVTALRGQRLSRRKRRVLEYKLAQMDFSKNPKAYANSLLDGFREEDTRVTPAAEEILTHYNEIFGSGVEAEHPTGPLESGIESKEISSPITEEEIRLAFQSSKSNSPGPDGVHLKDIKRIPVARLLLLFNSMLLLERVPDCLQKSRTILIPKTSENQGNVKNWRPITISSVFVRLLNKIIAKRLESSITLHNTQRGFSRIDGCFANNITVEAIIKTRRLKGQPFTIISLDLSKAFDRVQHSNIKRALHRMKIDPKTINYIMGNYTSATTEISCNGQNIGVLNIKKGVKQGDPLSPMLFNIVIDELLWELDNLGGIPVGDEKISTLAYADDILLCAEDDRDAGRMLQKTVGFMKNQHMHLNTEKCTSLVTRRVPSKKKVYVETNPVYQIDGIYIPSINIHQELSYLGRKFSFEGMKKCSTLTLFDQLKAIRQAPLKPQQKLKIITTYLIPRYIDSLQKPNISAKLLKEVDKKIRNLIKIVLHLPLHCSNSLFYAPIKSGGLGIFSFKNLIPIITRNRMNKLREASRLLENTILIAQPILERLEKQINGEWRNTTDAKRHMAEQFTNSYNGRGLGETCSHTKTGNFIKNPPIFWSGEDYIRALQLRYNVLPTVGIPSNPREVRLCRAGCPKIESLSHVLQNCTITHHERMARHNHVLKLLTNAVRRKGWQTLIEPHIRGYDGELKKPDIIMTKDERVIVCDVGVGWEGDITLTDQYFHKVSKYSTPAFVDKMRNLYPEKSICVLPMIMGARGTWCNNNDELIRQTNLAKSDVERFIIATLKGGWLTHGHFMSAVWRINSLNRRPANHQAI